MTFARLAIPSLPLSSVAGLMLYRSEAGKGPIGQDAKNDPMLTPYSASASLSSGERGGLFRSIATPAWFARTKSSIGVGYEQAGRVWAAAYASSRVVDQAWAVFEGVSDDAVDTSDANRFAGDVEQDGSPARPLSTLDHGDRALWEYGAWIQLTLMETDKLVPS